jgi:hypothetical protein
MFRFILFTLISFSFATSQNNAFSLGDLDSSISKVMQLIVNGKYKEAISGCVRVTEEVVKPEEVIKKVIR